MSASAAAIVESLLIPVPGGRPTGSDLRYSQEYVDIGNARKAVEKRRTELIEEARAQAAAARKADDQDADRFLHPVRVLRFDLGLREWAIVQKLATTTLATKSKDLQIAAWLAEAMAAQREFAGTRDGLNVCRTLVETFWDGLFPAPDPEDDDPMAVRQAPLEWLDNRLTALLNVMTLTSVDGGYALAHFAAAASTPRSGWPTAEKIRRAIRDTPAAALEARRRELTECLDAAEALAAALQLRMSKPVSFTALRRVLSESLQVLEGSPTTSVSSPTGQPNSIVSVAATPAGPEPAPVAGFWDKALSLVRDGRLDGLRQAQDHIDAAPSGRERFLRQLTLAELCVQAGMHALAFPIFDELGRTIDERKLDEWEDPQLTRRVWAGLGDVCGRLTRSRPDAEKRRQDAVERLERLDAEQAAR